MSGSGNWGGPPGGGFPPGGGNPGGFGPPGGGNPGGFGPPGGGNPGGFGPPGGGHHGGFGPPGGAPPGGFGPPGGAPPGGFGPPGGAPPGGFGGPPGGFGGPPQQPGGFGFPPQQQGGYGQQPGGWGAPPPQPPSPNRTPLIIGGVAVLVVVCSACAVAGYLNNQKTQKTFGALTAACEGRPVPGARAYAPGVGLHRVVGASSSGGTWSITNSRIPDAQMPQGVSDAEVVACFGEETQTVLGTCEVYSTRYGARVPGTTRTFSRSQKYLPVRLVAAATGQTITVGSVAGPVPTACNSSFGRPTATTFQGGSVGSSQLGPWLTAVLANGGTGMIPMGY